MILNEKEYSTILEESVTQIDVSPTNYLEAEKCYTEVGEWLEEGDYPNRCEEIRIYPQGSFRLGTVIRPIRVGNEAGYDIDLVCEFKNLELETTPSNIKAMVGKRLSEHDFYNKLLKHEGKRCWTLEYEKEVQNSVNFHLDVLPSVSDPRHPLDQSIAVTNKKNNVYTWSASNPQGYGDWFDKRNQISFVAVANHQKKKLLHCGASEMFSSVDEVPDRLVRTPLQRAIQIMKRHRDLKFNNSQASKYAPISIIITTLAALNYKNELDVFTTLNNIVSKMENRIIHTKNNNWHIGNPVNPKENFADRWNEDNNQRAEAFFWWIDSLKNDLLDRRLFKKQPSDLRNHINSTLKVTATAGFSVGIASPNERVFKPPKIAISNPAKPWRFE